MTTSTPTRGSRRRELTRAALIRSAQELVAEGRTEVPVLEITTRADVGSGSFYNHFESKEELFAAAIESALDDFGRLLDDLTADVTDPAEVFATSFRLTGRLHRRAPIMSRLLLHHGLDLAVSDLGLAPRARRDLSEGVRTGRFDVADLDLAMVVVAGSMLCLGRLLHDQPERDAGSSTDEVVVALLRHLGMDEDAARDLCSRPLPDLT